MNYEITYWLRRAVMIGLLLSWVICLISGSALAAQGSNPEEKIILCYMIELHDLELAKEWPKISQLPFNGMMFRMLNVQKVMRPKEIPWSDWQQNLDELKSVEFGPARTTSHLLLQFKSTNPQRSRLWL